MTMDLRWLHFSDLHYGHDEQHRTLWSEAKRALLVDLERVTAEHGPWDVVLFTGDLVQRGTAEEFRRLEEELLPEIWRCLGHPRPLLLAVPGNHDLVRPPARNLEARVVERNAKAGSLRERDREVVSSWFAPWLDWWQTSEFTPKPDNPDLHQGTLPGDWSFVLKPGGTQIGFVGLNSAWMHWRNVVEGALDLHLDQVEKALGGRSLRDWTQDKHASFVLTHHPATWLKKTSLEGFAKALRGGEIIAHLYGHMHELTTRRTVVNETLPGPREWQAASLFGLAQFRKNNQKETERRVGYTAGCLRMDHGERATLTLWPRRGERLGDGDFWLAPDTSFPIEFPEVSGTGARFIQLRRPVQHEDARRPSSSTWREQAQISALGQKLGSTDANLFERCLSLVERCEEVYRRSRHHDDPWTDPALPGRVLAESWSLLIGVHEQPCELAALLVLPFLREARLVSIGQPELAGPMDRIRARHPALQRAVERNVPPASPMIAAWMRCRAALLCPTAWQLQHLPKHLRDILDDLVRAVALGELDAAQLRDGARRLLMLCGVIGQDSAPPLGEGDRFADWTPLGRAKAIQMRDPAVALCLAGHLALDPRAHHAAVLGHLSDDQDLQAVLPNAHTSARWRREGAQRLLELRCAHHVLDFSIREMVLTAQSVIDKVLAASMGALLDEALLRRIPKRISADGLRPANGLRPYVLPHVRVTLDHERVRDLLIGEQLWGDPTVALRELYQNALDACRYRRARDQWLARTRSAPAHRGEELQIQFRQGEDELGRAYIECEDNGIGMAREHVERLFSAAGRRFVEDPEYLEEEASWPPEIRFYPNSRFGIGVLSYWLMADRVEVWTRRMEPDGDDGEPLQIKISSGDGLFELKPGTQDQPIGTRVRLLLNRATVRDAQGQEVPLSTIEVLTRLLWVAEFPTTVREVGGRSRRWAPGELGPVESDRCQPGRYLRVPGEPVWLCLDRPQEAQQMILVDGLRTEIAPFSDVQRSGRQEDIAARLDAEQSPMSRYFLEHIVGDRLAHVKLTVDRSRVLIWAPNDLDRIAQEHWRMLLEGERVTFRLLWQFAGARVPFLDDLVAELKRREVSILLHPASEDKPDPPRVRLTQLGLYAADPPARDPPEPPSVNRDVSITGTHRVWRWETWKRLGLGSPPGRTPHKLDLTTAPVPSLPDAKLLRALEGALTKEGDTWRYRDRAFRPGFGSVLDLCQEIDLSVDAIHLRLAEYGRCRLAPTVEIPANWDVIVREVRAQFAQRGSPIRELIGVIVDHEPLPPWRLHAGLVTCAAVLARAPVVVGNLYDALSKISEVRDILTPLPGSVSAYTPDHLDAKLLEPLWRGRFPHSKAQIPLPHLLWVALKERMPFADIQARLERYEQWGISPPTGWTEALLRQVTAEDLRPLSRHSNGGYPWWEAPWHGFLLWRNARQISPSPRELLARLCGVLDVAGAIDEAHRAWLASCPEDELQRGLFEQHIPEQRSFSHPIPIPALHVVRVADRTGRSVEEATRRLHDAAPVGVRMVGDVDAVRRVPLDWEGWRHIKPLLNRWDRWPRAMIAAFELSGVTEGSVAGIATRFEAAGVLPIGAAQVLATHEESLRRLHHDTLAALVWGYIWLAPDEPTPRAVALYDINRCLVYWETEAALERAATAVAQVLEEMDALARSW